MPGLSNGAYLPARPAAPLPGQGWTVKVYAHTSIAAYAAGLDPPALTVINRYTALSWSPEISDTGFGSITIPLTDPLWGHPLADGRPANSLRLYQNLFVVYEDGQWRGEFLGQRDTETLIGDGEAAARQVVLSGPGAAQVLAWAQVMTPYYPKATPKDVFGVWRFTDKPVMAAWLALLAAAKKRGTVPFVTCDFTPARDTGGQPWEDTPPVRPKTTAQATLAGDVLFDSGSFTLTTTGKAAIAAVVAKIAKVPFPGVTLVGHTDSVGTAADNQTLSVNRANAVAGHLSSLRPGVQITIVGKGETQPRATNTTAAGRARNRRVQVTYQALANPVKTIFEPEPGDLLALLRNLTSGATATERGPIHCEWVMGRRFRLSVRSLIGADRSATVVFHEGSSFVQAMGRDFDREKIANVVAVQTQAKGEYKVATSTASRRHWLQREAYTQLTAVYDAPIQARIAATRLAASTDEQFTATITITPGPGRRPWRDFGLGDTIGVVRPNGRAPSRLEKQRVVAITVSINAAGEATYELTLESTRAGRAKYLQAQIESLTNRRKGIRAFVMDEQPTGGLVGDLWTPETEQDTTP